MSATVYYVLHVAGIVWLFAAVGASAVQGMSTGEPDPAARKIIGASHGIALLLILVAGFGLHAKTGVEGFPGWFVGKLALWLLMGGLIAVARRSAAGARAIWFALPVLGGLGAWLAHAKPF